MVDRYADWHRQRNDDDTTSVQQAQGRKVLGLLMEELKLSGLPTGVKRWEAQDGTLYTASFDGTTPTIQIETAASPPAPPELPSIDLWIPQGFVFTPGNNASPAGFGLPVQFTQVAPNDAFHPTNTDPGLDAQRWRPGGPCAQVLLTRQDTTDYPRRTKRRIPVGFDRQEWMAGAYTAPAFSAWHAVRPRFNDFSWTPDVMGARRDAWRALKAAQGKPVSLPFAGYYDDAQLIADLGTGYGTNPAAWPLTPYRTETGRATVDGVPAAYDEAWTSGAVSDLTTDLGAFHDGVPTLGVGVRAGLKVATLRTQDAWIHAGNQFWHPSDPSLPTLSWDGYPAQNLPNWLVSGGWVGGVGSAIFPLEGWHYAWRGQTRYVFSRKLYAMGRCIGVAPATVISAAIRVETLQRADGTKYKVNRVVVITWDADDQFGNAGGIAYLWKFGVWCADFPRDGTIPLHVTAVPVGAYNATTNPTGWRKCGTFTFSTPGDVAIGDLSLPGYALWQLWRFNGDGMRAVAVVGAPPYSADWGPGGKYVEVMFTQVEHGLLNVSTQLLVASGVPESASWPIAADYAADGSLRFVMFARAYTGGLKVEGAQSAEDSVLWWTGGDTAQSMGSAFDAFAPDTWVLSAADGALGLGRYPLAGTAPVLTETRSVRLVHGGATVAVDAFADSAVSMLSRMHDSSYLSDVLMSYAADRAGNWMLGYDAGLTAGSSIVYDPSAPPSAPFKPAPVSTHLNSHWLSNTGDVASMTKFDGAMRAYPLGVC